MLVHAPAPQPKDTYDAVIGGSGAAGGMAAHVLTSHGLAAYIDGRLGEDDPAIPDLREEPEEWKAGSSGEKRRCAGEDGRRRGRSQDRRGALLRGGSALD